jgi:hypothetical protein
MVAYFRGISLLFDDLFLGASFRKRQAEGRACAGLRYATVLSREEQAGKELNPLHPWRFSENCNFSAGTMSFRRSCSNSPLEGWPKAGVAVSSVVTELIRTT